MLAEMNSAREVIEAVLAMKEDTKLNVASLSGTAGLRGTKSEMASKAEIQAA
jgi:hypothetical protein